MIINHDKIVENDEMKTTNIAFGLLVEHNTELIKEFEHMKKDMKEGFGLAIDISRKFLVIFKFQLLDISSNFDKTRCTRGDKVI